MKELRHVFREYPELENLTWKKAGSWPSPVLRRYLYVVGSLQKPLEKYTGLPVGFQWQINVDPHIYESNENYDPILDAVERQVFADPTYLEVLSERLRESIRQNLVFSGRLNCDELREMSNKELAQAFEKFVALYLELIPYAALWMDFNGFAERIMRKVFGSDFNTSYAAFMTVRSESETSKANALLCEIRETKDPELVENYRQSFGWLHVRHWRGSIPTSEQVQEMAEHAKEIEKPTQKFTHGLKGDLQQIAEGVREQVHLKTFRKEMMSKIDVQLQPLWEEVAHRMNITYDDFINCTLPEIREFFDSGKVPKQQELKQRRKGWACILRDGEITIRTDLQQATDESNTQHVTGETAFHGVVEGTIRVIATGKEALDVQQGEIVVADMTNPDMLPAFHKARGIITNRGGKLCHAAVLSREFRIPCLTGTEHATEVFATGDLVWLDATNGSARKL